jgi:cell fate (sporulation/competence/biofilm development) regulator YlbF (YheA/YmcA/DUF963 family)
MSSTSRRIVSADLPSFSDTSCAVSEVKSDFESSTSLKHFERIKKNIKKSQTRNFYY